MGFSWLESISSPEKIKQPLWVFLAGRMQMEEQERQTLRQDLQDEQDEFPMQDQPPNAVASLQMGICSCILLILLILSNFDVLTALFRLGMAKGPSAVQGQ
jgi:hypothetical protein